ncbi:DsbA family protein [Actimicrobium antarcticum]|uniref:DsbA family protein n=1 Tax=Actimicrobium antarcticum TaxID=1051899 RepID=A0ABP7TGF5_9BURK
MPNLIYIADPMCSWCYGFGPELSALLEGLPGLPVEIIVGGLRAYSTDVMDEAMKEDLMTHWKKVHETSGLAMSDQAIEQPGFVYNTEPACRAVVAARSIAPSASLAVFSAVQHAFYVEGRDVTRANVLAEVASKALTAAGFPIDAAAFETLWSSEKIVMATHADFVQTKNWKIDGFPMLVLERNGQLDMVTSGYTRMPALIEQLQMLVDNSPQA